MNFYDGNLFRVTSSLRAGVAVTSIGFRAVLKKAKIAISMDGRGACRDNVFVERLWRTIKYEETIFMPTRMS